MSREVKRVPLPLYCPLNDIWEGYLLPDRLAEDDCPDCERGYSPHGEHLHDLWYGHIPFEPESTGSTPFTPDTPAVREAAEHHVRRAPEFYGTGERAVVTEAERLCSLWNGMWCHHLDQDDVNALVEAGRLRDLTHTWTRETGWQAIEPPIVPTPEQVNTWSLRGLGHDSINAGVVIEARCKCEGVAETCSTCDGYGTMEACPGQRAEAEAWQPAEPPTGEGWQLWETVSEGSPVSPVFATAEELAHWLTTPEGGKEAGAGRPMTISQARGFVGEGWAPTAISNAGGFHDGASYVGSEAVLRNLEEDQH